MSNEAKLGSAPTSSDGRDAVHVAIIPVEIGDKSIPPGTWVTLKDGKAVQCNPREAIGVIDPFYKMDLARGEWAWLCLYPKTITSLRHVWEHPSFPNSAQCEDAVVTKSRNMAQSVAWIKDYVRTHCSYWENEPDGGYKQFIERVSDDRTIFYYGSDCHSLEDVEDSETLFQHLSVVLGKRISADYFHSFTCSC